MSLPLTFIALWQGEAVSPQPRVLLSPYWLHPIHQGASSHTCVDTPACPSKLHPYPLKTATPWALLRSGNVHTSSRMHPQGDGPSKVVRADPQSRLGDVWTGIIRLHGLEQENVGSGQAWSLDPLPPHPTEGRVGGEPEPALCSPLCQDQRHCCEGAATVAKIRAQLDSEAHDLSYHSKFRLLSIESAVWSWLPLATSCWILSPLCTEAPLCFRPKLWLPSSEPWHALSLLSDFAALIHIFEMSFSFFFAWTTSNYLKLRSDVQSRGFSPL